MPDPVAAPIVPPPVPVDLDAPDATRVALDETVVAHDLGQAPSSAPAVESLDADLAGRMPEPTTEDPGQTMLADDLFEDAAPPNAAPRDPTPVPPAVPAPPPIPEPVAVAPSMPPAMDSGFEFGAEAPGAPVAPNLEPSFEAGPTMGVDSTDATDPLGGMLPESPSMPPVPAPNVETTPAPALADAADSTHSGYDVSSSDLGDPLGAPPEIPDLSPEPEPLTTGPTPPPIAPEVLTADLGVSAPEPLSESSGGNATPDLSPMMRERIHETLEKIAWEAFADVSDSIVRQVIERVESIVWEVVPQMAEALIQEEIRRMKGDDD
jgi:hypothetical protein